jgi:iron complex outermembrane receptor protein
MSAHAQDEETDETDLSETVIDLGTIYVEDTLLESEELLDRPTSFATVLDPQELSKRAITLSEALDAVPGVTVRTFGGLGALSTISIRGAGSESVLVLLDGVPLNPTGGMVDLSDIPLSSLERIEIIRGGEGSSLGAGAVGGVVRLISLSPGEEDQATQSGHLTFGSFGTATAGFTWTRPRELFHAEFDSSQGDFSFLNDNGTAFDNSDDFPDTRDNNDYAAFETRFSRAWDLADNRTLNLSGEWFRADKGIPGITTFPTSRASQDDRRLFLRAGYDDTTVGDGSIAASIAWLRQDRDFADPLGEATGVPLDTSWSHDRLDFRAEWTGTGWSENDILSSGANFVNEKVDSSVYGNENRDTLAAWVRDEWYIPDGPVITGAMRCDAIDGDTTFSPRGGIRLPLSDNTSIRANLGLDFRPPGFEELYRNEGLVVGNPDLAPERTLNFDFGLTHTSERLRLEAVYFNLQTRDLIDYLLISGFRWKPYNIGRARSSGIELSADIALDRNWALRLNYTRTRAIDTSGDPLRNGNPLVGIPSSDFLGELRWRESDSEAWINWQRHGASPLTPSGTRFLPGCQSTGLGVGYTLAPDTTLSLEMKNIFDEGLFDVRGFPLPGRSLFLTLRGEW